MGEFIVDSPTYDDKMGETATSKPALEVSVSFGRFENDSLSWEKWSAFSPNKYLEEVEKCATPGSVAKKKAYFEAHYKKIAARKAELMGQEKQMDKGPLRSDQPDDPSGEDLAVHNSLGDDSECDVSNTQNSAEEVEQVITCSNGEMSETHVNNIEEEVAFSAESQSTPRAEEIKEVERGLDGCKTGKSEAICVEVDETQNIEPGEEIKEIQQDLESKIEKASEVEVVDVKLDHPKESKKVTSVNKESNAAKVKKKSVQTATKAAHIPTPRVSRRPAPTPTKMVTPGPPSKKGNSPTLPRSTGTSMRESKQLSNRSLHMSLCLSPSNPNSSSVTTMRKSLLMEKMGDKDIVKRAFKSFQNNYNQPKVSVEEKSSTKKKVPPKGIETMSSPPMIMRNGRPTKVDAVDKSIHKTVPSPFGLKSDIRAEKRKEFSKKLNEKSNAKQAERTRLQSKSKQEKEVEIQKLRHNLNFKATPLPSFYRGQKSSKSGSNKGNMKTGICQ